jgi:glutamate synthase domain-containing protein 1
MTFKNRYPGKDISGCGLFGFINEDGRRVDGNSAKKGISLMRDRSNGLGGGFASYGIYPRWKDHYAFHVMYENEEAQRKLEALLPKDFVIDKDEKMPHRHSEVIDEHPILWRYFLKPREYIRGQDEKEPREEELVVRTVMNANANIDGAYIFSSGKDMGIFKAVGYPEDVADFFRIEEYEGYTWTAHGRFPTNTPGWWGGAHPFGLLNWSVVHNGEISSYGINKRYLEMFGYKCNLMTDTEVVSYLADLLIRKHGMSIEAACNVLAPRFWKDILSFNDKERLFHTSLRQYYGAAMMNGPFAILVGNQDYLFGLSDRVKLRPLVAARKGNTLYMSSEESAIVNVCKDPDVIWHPKAGVPTIGMLKPEVLPR